MVCENIDHSRIELVRRNSRRWTGLLLALVTAAVVAACSQTMPSPTPLPSPTDVPTATPTPVPVVIFEDATLPAPDPEGLARLSRLFSSVPASHNTAVFMDIQALENSSLLREAVDLEELGLQGILPTVATGLLDGLAIAATESGQDPITVLDGKIDVETLLQLAGGFGISVGEPKSETYRGHGIWTIDVFGIGLAVGQADANTVVMTSDSFAGGAPALELVKSSMDTFDGLSPSLLDDSANKQLLSRLPTGFSTALIGPCGDLKELVAVIDLPGCASAAISADVLDPDGVVFYGLALFQEEGSAAAALQMALQRIQAQGELLFGDATVGQDEKLVWIRGVVDPAKVAQALKAFSSASP